MTESLKAKTIKNVSYNAIGRMIAFGFQGVSNIILSRELGANDYGIVGFALIFINFLRSFGDLGINSAVVQTKKLDKDGLYTAYTVKTILGILIFLVAYVLSDVAKYYFDNKDVVIVIKVLSLNFIINSFAFIPNVLLTRDLDYKRKSIAETVLIASNSLLAIIFVYNGFTYWSMVLGNVLSVIMYVLFLNVSRPVKICFAFNKVLAFDYLKYGSNLFLSGIIVFLVWNLDNFIIGATKGATTLGYYSIAFNWGAMISTILVSVLFNVMFPTLSRLRDQKTSFKNAFIKMSEYTLLISISVNMTLFCVADDYLTFVLGKGTTKWELASIPLQILCFYGVLRSVSEMISCTLMSIGKTNILFKATLLIAVVEAICIYPVLNLYGIVGVSVLVTFTYVLQGIFYFKHIKHEIGVSCYDFVPIAKQSMALMVGFIFIRVGFAQFEQSIILFAVKIITCLIVFVMIHGFMTSWKLCRTIRNFQCNN